MSFLRKAFSKRTLGHSKDSSLSGPEIAEPLPDQFGYFGNAGQVGSSVDIRGSLNKPVPPFYSMNGRGSANGSSSSRIGQDEPPTFTRAPQDETRGGTRQIRQPPNLAKAQPELGNPWASEAEKQAEAQYSASPIQEVSPQPKLMRPRPSKPNFLVNIAGLSVESPISDASLSHSSPENEVNDEDSYVALNRRRLPSLATIQDPYLTPVTPSNSSEIASPTNDDSQRTRRRKRQENTSFLQAIAESHLDPPTRPLTPVSPDLAAPAVPDEDIPLAKRIEEAAKLARLKAAGPSLSVPEIVPSIAHPLTPPPELEPILHLPPSPPEDDIPPPPPSKLEDPLAVTDIEALQDILDRTLRELQQAKEENQRLQVVQAQQEQDRNLIEKLQVELLNTPTNPRHSHPPPPTRPPPPVPDNDNDDHPFFTPLTSPSEVSSDPETELLKLRQETAILRKQLSNSKSRIEALVEDKARLEQKHRQEIIDFLNRLKEKQELEDQRLKELKSLKTERDLADVRVDSIQIENKQLVDDRDDILQQLKFQVEENQRMEEEVVELKKEVPKFMTYKSQMRDKEAIYNKLSEEKAGWQAQIDVMQHKLSEAERRVRCLDNIERQRYESKQEGGYGSGSTVGRSALLHHSPHVKGPSVDVSAAVSAFNQEVQHAAWMLSDVLERPTTDMLHMLSMFSEHQRRKTKMRAKLIWGEKVMVLLEQHANATKRNDLLMLTCMEVFITHWCVQIIEGWYPYLASFSDILIQLVEQKGDSDDRAFQKICGKQAQVIRTGSGDPDYDNWIKEITDDLLPLLRLSGVRIPSSESDLLSTKLLPILKLAYNLRLALAERDICGGLELAVPLPDTPFHPTFMDSGDAGKKSRKLAKEASSQATDWTVEESIAGTKAIGLKRTLDGKLGQYEMVVLPQVMFVRELEASV
ncbi:hypothetical protein CPB83DRAFT_890458 [Crepidotus variabilis]|uniref:Uncharacterized protein n=1 Tax=Crepidotus variabilis TaxID=179855 RepID=A0A9P6EN28_9AGAR|nr:hypothetical protein CPB83DRAFT_890458 [Crepidotus variabilis]